jgi:opacity protein-like surface antigen
VSAALRFALVALGLAALLPAADAAAQRRGGGSLIHGPIEAGPRFGRDFKNHAWTVGGQVRVPVGQNLELRPSGDLIFPRGEGMGWQLNGDAAIRIGQGGGLYAGGGIALVHPDDGESETGYNLFFGLSTAPPNAPMKPFLEFRWTDVADTRPFRLMAGFSWTL